MHTFLRIGCLALAMGLALGTVHAADDEFSEIPVSSKVLPPTAIPAHNWPRQLTKPPPLPDPRSSGWRSFFRDPRACGVVGVSFFVAEDGEVRDVKVSQSSGVEFLDKAALNHVRGFEKFEPARFEGRPVGLWRLIPVRFSLQQEEGTQSCESPEAKLERDRLSAEYSQPLKTLLEQAYAENEKRRLEEQRLVDAQEAKRFAIEEPYRVEKLSQDHSPARLAVKANQLYWNLLKCGDSYIGGDENFLIEYRGLRLYLKETDKLSSIDRANGYEWRGSFGAVCEMERVYGLSADSYAPGEWGEWHACKLVTTRLSKKNGKWYVGGLYRDGIRPPLSCATLPK